MRRLPLLLMMVVALAATSVSTQTGRALSSADIDDIALLLKHEDTRVFDDAALGRVLRSAHPEVRRRAAVTIGRINNDAGRALLTTARADADQEVVASVAFATGQLRDPDAVFWLNGRIDAAGTAPVVAREAAQALGKIQTPEARGALARFLLAAPTAAAAAPVVGEALLAIGRYAGRHDLAPILRWVDSPDENVRWRATWALLRPRDPAALPHLIKLANDPSGEVRYWAVRGLIPSVVDEAAQSRPAMTARLRTLFQRDPDRRVRTEALRTLLQYDDETAFGALVNALYSPDAWLAVSAAEAAGRFTSRARVLAPVLKDVSEPQDPLSVRIAALPSLVTLAPGAAGDLAMLLARVDSASARTAAFQALGRLGDDGQAALDMLRAEPALAGLVPAPAPARGAGAARGGGGGAAAAGAGRGGGGGGGRGASAPRPARPDAEYRQLVERWIVPDYDGRPRPRVIWDTARGPIEIELHPGDAPFGVEHLMRVIQSGDIVGTEFTRLVPDFVAQQQAIRNTTSTLRDEVNRHGLLRATLSWASAGLDTGRPGYTLGHTPQPHNEGNFTALGRVVAGMDAVDRLEIGDTITAARLK